MCCHPCLQPAGCRHSRTCMQHRLQPVEPSRLCTRTTQAAGNEQAAP
jgi:hypothetical protein